MTKQKDNLGLSPGQDGVLWPYSFSGMRHSPHRHDELEVNLVTRGRAAYLVGDQRYEMRAGTMVWLFPEQEHVLLDQSADHAMWIGVFTPSLLRRACTTSATQPLCAADPPGLFCKRLPDEDSRRLDGLFHQVLETRPDAALHNAALGYALLSAWAAYRHTDDAPAGSDVHPAVECAVHLLRGPDAPDSLPALAGRVGLSASRLSRLFQEQTGVSVTEFRHAQRVERFLRLYGRRSGRMSVLEAALEAGFGSYPQFHRVFVRRMGCSPAAYRRKTGQG